MATAVAVLALVLAGAACGQPDRTAGDGGGGGDGGGREVVTTADVEPVPDGELEVHFIDVGQGDATLLRTAEAAVLVDAGRHDADDVVGYLGSVGVEHLDVVAITHPHADHLGQFDAVLEAIDVEEVWWSGATHTTRTFERALDALEASDAAYEEPRADDTTSLGRLRFEVLNPDEEDDLDDLDASSLVFRVTWGDVRILFTGDADAATERAIIDERGDRLAADVYQVGHHGSSTSTTAELLEAVDPAIAVYSAGAGNSYGHPHEEVIDRLAEAGVEVYGTDVHGTVVLTTDGRGWTVKAEHRRCETAGHRGAGGGACRMSSG